MAEPTTVTLDREKFEEVLDLLEYNYDSDAYEVKKLKSAIVPDPPDDAQKRIAELEKALQDKCHDLPASDYVAFCDGCDQEQRKLFGKCRTDELKQSDAFERAMKLFDAYEIAIRNNDDHNLNIICEFVDEFQKLVCDVRGHRFFSGERGHGVCTRCMRLTDDLGYVRNAEGWWVKK